MESTFTVPDLLGDEGRQDQTDRLVAEMLHNLQRERVRLTVLQTANMMGDDDIVPGGSVSFEDSFNALQANEQKIAAAFGPECMERIPGVVEKMRSGQ